MRWVSCRRRPCPPSSMWRTRLTSRRTATDDAPRVGVRFNGTRRDLAIEDIIAIHGPRNPSSAQSSRVHRQAFLFVVSAGRHPGTRKWKDRTHTPRVGVVLPRATEAACRRRRPLRCGTALAGARYRVLFYADPSQCKRLIRRMISSLSCSDLPLACTGAHCRSETPASRAASRAAERQQRSAVEARRLDLIEPLVREAIQEKKLPGAVVLIGRGDRIIYQKAFGNRALVPAVEAMTLDTVFDLASLTKVVATTTSVMMLVEQGRIRLNDRVASYIPGSSDTERADITVRHLLTHVSGLRPDVDLAERGRALTRPSRSPSKKCPASARASASSTATSISSFSATSSVA